MDLFDVQDSDILKRGWEYYNFDKMNTQFGMKKYPLVYLSVFAVSLFGNTGSGSSGFYARGMHGQTSKLVL
jgi:hypothetical protein